MPTGFQSIHFHVIDQKDEDLTSVGARPLALRGVGPRRRLVDEAPTFNSEEAAARSYLSRLLARDRRPSMRGLTAPDRPEVVPDLQLRESRRSAITDTWTVKFVQTKASVPIFGSRAVVELDSNRELVGVDADLADVPNISALPAVSADGALRNIAELAGVEASELCEVKPPQLTFYNDEKQEQWHLSYLFKNVPAAPHGFAEATKTHGIGRSLAQRHPELHYLVDAHDGKVLLYWSASPTVDIPAACSGTDEEGVLQSFFGRQVPPSTFELHDPMRNVRTIDFGLKDIESDPPPLDAIRSSTNVFGSHAAAVSAHFNATRVVDFCKSVLLRDGLDDKGMELVSYINCTVPSEEPPPEWHNAAWWKQRMWYGQAKEGGSLRSFARFLDVIAHELAHGLTEFTADLVYLNESGALNESFSDIFGVIVKNWDWSKTTTTGGDIAAWNWEIGPGLAGGGKPLRDMSNPKRTNDPDHYGNRVQGPADNGGVHTNSNIHNKAAYNVLTAVDAANVRMFSPKEVALLYYLTMTRLGQLADFSATLQTLVNVAGTYFAGDGRRNEKLAAIRAAYAAVGIS